MTFYDMIPGILLFLYLVANHYKRDPSHHLTTQFWIETFAYVRYPSNNGFKPSNHIRYGLIFSSVTAHLNHATFLLPSPSIVGIGFEWPAT